MRISKKTYTQNANGSSQLKRRQFLQRAAASCVLLSAFPANAISSALQPNIAKKKVVWIFLRGALDSLHTVIPVGDPNLPAFRADIVDPIKEKLLPLDNHFALHPNLTFLKSLYAKKQMSPVVAVASGYRQRSHFEAQDQMESGLNETNHESGWMARALKQIHGKGIAISRSLPIAMRDRDISFDEAQNTASAQTWYPSRFPEASEDLLSRLQSLYKNDSALNSHLDMLIAQKQNPSMQMQEKQRSNFAYLANKCGELLAQNKATQCAMLEFGGWDTHNNQQGRLARLFTELDTGIKNLQTSLGTQWDDTLVVVSTEFGRTVALNGTKGTDHGTASNMFVLGGALSQFTRSGAYDLSGGKVLGDWPGLEKRQLFQERDLMPTSDVRAWMAAALAQHWQLNKKQLSLIFPDLQF